jgi:hypothetical protein
MNERIMGLQNCAALLLLLLARGGGDGRAGEAGDVVGTGTGTGAAGCSKGCAASLDGGVGILSLKENKNFYANHSTVKLLMYVCP